MMYALYTEKQIPGREGTDKFYYAGYGKNGGPIIWVQDREQAMWFDSMQNVTNLQGGDEKLSKAAGVLIAQTD